jgi:UDP-GlcNAc:undecaprenyl-phosphate GlcNAc-1-phosphate transferase
MVEAGSPFLLAVLLTAAFAASAVLCRAVMALWVKDAPDGGRKTQAAPVPTSGGLGFAAATALGLAAVHLTGVYPVPTSIWIALAGALAVLVMGAWDDRWPLPPRPRLILLLAIALALVAFGVRVETFAPWPSATLALPAAVAAAGSIAWLVVVMNAVNFMDGANGLSMGMAAVASAGLAIVALAAGEPGIAIAAAFLCAGLCGFLLWNIPGRLYAGDAGALFTGALLASLSLLLVKAKPELLLIPPLLLLPFLTDVLLTLAWRAKRGRKLFEAHRDHVYQIALKAGLKHWHVAAVHAIWAFNAAAVGVVASLVGGRIPAAAFILFLAASIWVNAKARKSIQ